MLLETDMALSDTLDLLDSFVNTLVYPRFITLVLSAAVDGRGFGVIDSVVVFVSVHTAR